MQRKLSAPDLDFDAVRNELGISEDYGASAQAEADHPVDRFVADREDRTDLPFVTIDPPTSRDLDQAVHIVADDDGFVVNYAIADVAALIEPEGALDAESRRRGTTVYFPDCSVPLHPRSLSEGAGSLLPDQTRPCVLWTIRVGADGEPGDVSVGRATMRSVAKLDYAGVSADAAAGRLHPSIEALPAFGELRHRVALDRGAVELDLPDQEVVRAGGDAGRPARSAPGAGSIRPARSAPGAGWTLRLAPHTPADLWNSQLSLLTGMCAGQMMAGAGIGLLRTLPPADPRAVAALRAAATSLDVDWPADASPGQFLAGLPRDEPATLALMSVGATLMRGADYLALGSTGDGDVREAPSPDRLRHAAIAGLYAHVTAPLRRLGDRFATEACLAVAAGDPVPDWVSRALPTLPRILRAADSLASSAERASIDLTEAVVLAGREGETFAAVVLHAATEHRAAQVFLTDPAVIAPCDGDPMKGRRISVVLTVADPSARKVLFVPAGG
ncbi:RNB domain-containing ribonuclease [Gordonia hankookensis]|uniref:RNB domain-containing ribonuclease n=1 Tax=Gordonia hankookensis TaxID=589403 RepID=A0ABR7W5T2_9ACTN|nr:RNB domain-containing ribonuclease [Gordonia hankookensis]MBD1318186.1 RNB domain-containing ribonuclease [Gordonia hankookensis]